MLLAVACWAALLAGAAGICHWRPSSRLMGRLLGTFAANAPSGAAAGFHCHCCRVLARGMAFHVLYEASAAAQVS